MTKLPPIVTGAGVDSDWSGEKFKIYFFSVHNSLKFYLADGEVTEDINKALETDDINFALEELNNLINDKDFTTYLEGMFSL